MFLAYRATDAVITIRQDNVRKAVEIYGMNPVAEKSLGYALAAISGLPLAALLPERIRQLLEEYVEFDPEGNDVGAVLSKVPRFCVLHRNGKELAYRLKVQRGEPINGSDCFHLVLQSYQADRKVEMFKTALAEHFKGHERLEEKTGLPDRASIQKDLEFLQHYVNKQLLTGCVAVAAIDQYADIEKHYGEAGGIAARVHVASLAKQNLRAEDMVGCAGQKTLAIILLETDSDSARLVLNRLRWLVASSQLNLAKTSMPLTISLAFSAIESGSVNRELLDQLEARLEVLGSEPGNALVELTKTDA